VQKRIFDREMEAEKRPNEEPREPNRPVGEELDPLKRTSPGGAKLEPVGEEGDSPEHQALRREMRAGVGGGGLDTPGGVPEVQDQLGCGPGQTVSYMESMLLERLTERRALVGAKGLYVSGDLMLAARDAALQKQGGLQFPASASPTECRILVIEATAGGPQAPADPSSLITEVARSQPENWQTLVNADWNEVGVSVFGSCYRLGAVIIVGRRQAAPGPNPDDQR
jgi:hypothetical protein